MSILDNLLVEAQQCLAGRESEVRIDNLIVGKTLYTIKDSGAVFNDMNFCLVLFENAYGFSYFQNEVDHSLSECVNENAFDVLDRNIPNCLRIAVIDALFCLINEKIKEKSSVFKGDLRKKARERATVLLSSIPDYSKVLLLGVATEILEEAKRKGCALKALDLEKQKIGLKLHSINIEDGARANLEREIQQTDYIIATGMIFVSQAADAIFELAHKHDKRLILFMETGSNAGPQLIKYGADVVLSEFFPYYDFYGETKYLISSKK